MHGLPAALPPVTVFGLGDERVLRQHAQVIAGGSGRLPCPDREFTRGRRAVLPQHPEQPDAQGVREGLQGGRVLLGVEYAFPLVADHDRRVKHPGGFPKVFLQKFFWEISRRSAVDTSPVTAPRRIAPGLTREPGGLTEERIRIPRL